MNCGKYLMTLLLLICCSTSRGEKFEIPLWPDGTPTLNGLESESETSDSLSGWTANVSVPVLYVYTAKNPNGMMVIDCPGGGYAGVSMNNEGHDWAEWMNRQGITYAVVKYRMPNGNREVPLDDVRRAMAISRNEASKWGVNPECIGIMGASAGGHLAASLATLYGDPGYRPDFQILFYPVISMGDDTHRGSRDNLLGPNPTPGDISNYSLANRVDSATPPAILLLAADDTVVPPSNSLDYTRSLIDNNVPVELHIYPDGGHGFGFNPDYSHSEQLKADLSFWLMELGKSMNTKSPSKKSRFHLLDNK